MDRSSIYFDAGVEMEDLLSFASITELVSHLGKPRHRTSQGSAADPMQVIRDYQYLLKLAGDVASQSVKINCNAVFNPAWVAAETAALGLGGGVGWLWLAMALSNLGLLAVGMVLLVTTLAGAHPNRMNWASRHPRMLLSTATGLLALSLVLVGLRVVSVSHPLPRLIRRAIDSHEIAQF